jgi:ubiquinone/menaquinone biosynthesis C-methylase UbiE
MGADPPDHPLVAWGRRRAAARVLDIAAGDDGIALAFARFTGSVVAVHTTERCAHDARARARAAGVTSVRCLAADVPALPFRDETFGVVTCRRAAHRFPELLPPLRQVARVLRRGGSFLVEAVLAPEEPDAAALMADVERCRDPRHVRAFRHIEWTAFLRAAGLTVIDEAVATEQRSWTHWTAAMSEHARRDLERRLLATPEPVRTGAGVVMGAGRIDAFAASLVQIRADRD